MSTNFYALRPVAFGHPERIHLGKSSAGWRFLFKADPEWPRHESMIRWLEIVLDSRTVIVDESDEAWPTIIFLNYVLLFQELPGSHDALSWHLTGGYNFTDHEFS